MSTSEPLNLLGVIEGFYGRPWTPAQRSRLYGWMATWGMNTYLYAPKDDLWHRARWREPYPSREQEVLASLVTDARAHGVRFVYALAPGLDIDWQNSQDREALIRKTASLTALGVEDFALLFDDIPYQPDRAAQALEQVEATHHVQQFLEAQGVEGLLLFCPTEYCAERAAPSVATSPYLSTLGERLDSRVEVFWTGPQIVSPEISVESVREVARALRRRPLLWDNFYASDYTSRRLHLGPYSGRPLELRGEVSGILCNPNTPLEPNFPGLASLADYAAASSGWTAEASGQRALNAWLPEFTSHQPAQAAVNAEDLAFVADTLFVPHQIGPKARQILEAAQRLAEEPGHQESRTTLLAGRRHFRRVLHALETGPNRDLLYDLHPFLVDVNEELTRLLAAARGGRTTFPYRGGLADALLRLGWSDRNMEPARP
ncbi:beta-N-acetylglucosaminidase domain-containing protein [Deinococcus sp. UYEF24]